MNFLFTLNYIYSFKTLINCSIETFHDHRFVISMIGCLRHRGKCRQLIKLLHNLLFVSVSLLEFSQHCSLLLFKLFGKVVDVLSILVGLGNSLIVKILGACIEKLVSCISLVLCSLFHLVELLSVSLFVLSHLYFILVNVISNLNLKILNSRPRMSVIFVNCKLVMVDVVLRLSSVMINSLSVHQHFIVHLFVHALFHHEFLLFLLMHISDEFCLSLSVPDSFLGSLLFLGELDESCLESQLLVMHHL